MRSYPIKSMFATLLVAAAFVIIGVMAMTFMLTDAAYAAGDGATHYDYDATATQEELAEMPGVYRVHVDMNRTSEPKTIGIPSVAKQNLSDAATKEMPAIIMGAAVNYEVRTGPTEFTPIEGAELLPPYSYFRWGIMEEQTQEPDGPTTTHKKLSGFDGSYYIVRVDVSKIIADAAEKADSLDGKYLHVRQENNKALLVATGMTDYSFVWADTSQTNNKGGCKAAAYSLANNGAAMLDTSGNDRQTPYLDVILMSSAKNVAGADTGGTAAPVSNVDLSFYVDDTKDYKPWLKALDPNNMPTFPYDVKDEEGTVLGHYQTEADYNNALATKFFDASKATSANSATKYRLMGEDLEIDVAVDNNETPEGISDRSAGINWLEEKMDFWSMEKAIYNDSYDNHTIILICEVPVLDALNISGTQKRSVILDVNSFDIQIANNNEQGQAGLTIGNNASLRLMDSSNTAGAELAIGNNATMVIQRGGTMIIDETCTAEAEFDAASTVDPSTTPAHYLSGEITIQDGGRLVNRGVVNIEGTEGKAIDPSQTDPAQRDKQTADILVEYGGVFDNYGCLSLKGVLYIMGTLNNYGKYNDILTAYDPDKNKIDYHRGIQVTWKDDVTQGGVEPGILNIGIDANKNIENRAELNNYGDIVLVPGTLNLYGTLNNDGKLYHCTVDEAIIPVVNPENPLEVERRVKLDSPKKSVLNMANGTFINNGHNGEAKVELIHNGVLGKLTPIGTFPVTFLDGQGNTLKIETVEPNGSATAPDNPTRPGYTFIGWDQEFTNITEEIEVTALWEKNPAPVDPVKKVTDLINALTESYDEAKVKAAREAYDKLTDEQKAKISDEVLQKLVEAENAVKSAQDQEAANKVLEKIAGIPDDPSQADMDTVSGAVEAYLSLTPDQKKLIPESELNKLQNALNYPSTIEKVILKSVKAKKGKKAVVKWEANPAGTGYQLYYKAKGVKAKKVNINGAETVKKVVKKLKPGKKYTFKIRIVNKIVNLTTEDPMNVYGQWSNVKKAKARK